MFACSPERPSLSPSPFTRIQRSHERGRGTDASCPACDEPILEDDHAVRIQGSSYHASCVLYRRRPRLRERRP